MTTVTRATLLRAIHRASPARALQSALHMIVGILQVELSIPWAQTLKDKRRVVSSIKDQLHGQHMVSVAEVDTQDDCTTATLGIVIAASDLSHAMSVLDRIVGKLKVHRDCVLDDHQMELLTGK